MWNAKYTGKISMWDGGSRPVMLAGPLTDPPAKDIFHQTADELTRSKDKLIEQRPLNAFYWVGEYGDLQPSFKPGDIWIMYAWPADYKAMGEELGYD
jgi:spermidine/putrescine-binding protein